jgi:hypothetical protein
MRIIPERSYNLKRVSVVAPDYLVNSMIGLELKIRFYIDGV